MHIEIEDLIDKIRKHVRIDGGGIPRVNLNAVDMVEELKNKLIKHIAGELLDEAIKWIEVVKTEINELVEKLRLRGFTLPKEFSSFIMDPHAHLKKKLFNYTYDLIRGRIEVNEFLRKAAAAIRTSLRTNMRSAYQIWCIAASMNLLVDEYGYDLEFPEHRFLNFDRSGKQKLGIIPPNVVLINYFQGYISVFHEAPRPLGWEDTSDLQKVWSLYTALRPDLLVYGGKVLNIVDLSRSPPIMRPDILVEFKELPDWYQRTRDLRGYFRKPLTAEEWRSKWLEGLFEGLADIMGVKRSEIKQRVESSTTLRVREYKLVQLYASTYRPKKSILVSKSAIPADVKEELSRFGIIVLDDVGFNKRKLHALAEDFHRVAKFGQTDCVSISIPTKTLRKLSEVCRSMSVSSISECIEKIVDFLMKS